ncbi:hypothetical protein [Pseudorhodoferax sp. Leaf274]|uniref:hypothetical protein n=1 Tax=Pseudorhodoferax sp. Leaf274 TaxID=1736318 RepID=UPI000703B741|nr:hypothetical protein [Pseudorhodoferax sp. Leaf274]KQP46243.1 hypothetical protein ASF44_24980 [Pseudorhodoferax sp. Leaf274]
MEISELAVLRWVHIVCMVYWLGGEWGIFNTSVNIVNRRLPMEERRRHMETAYRIDILARSGIILLLPLGMHMGHFWGTQPFGGGWLVAMWVLAALWLGLCLSAFFCRESDLGIRLTKIDERVRFVLIPLLVVCAVGSLLGHGPFMAEPGQRWFSAKILMYSGTLVIGLYLRFVMREWTMMFRELAKGPNPKVEATLERSLRLSRFTAYCYWAIILSIAFLGAVKPF